VKRLFCCPTRVLNFAFYEAICIILCDFIQSNPQHFFPNFIHINGQVHRKKQSLPPQLSPANISDVLSPFHTIIPAFITKDGAPYMSFGVMGGEFQPLGHVQIVMNMIDFGMNAQEAGDAPHIAHTGHRSQRENA
jgi:hypothetical protein